jgi:hypothetical protein
MVSPRTTTLRVPDVLARPGGLKGLDTGGASAGRWLSHPFRAQVGGWRNTQGVALG